MLEVADFLDSYAHQRNRLGESLRMPKSSRMKLSSCRSLPVAVFLALATVARADSSAPSFRVGTAKRDITPKEPVPMWGYGARHDALSTGALDPLYATALVL